MLAKPFAEDRDPDSEPEYAFEGLDVEFSEKVVLTPPAAARSERKAKAAS